MVGRLPRLRRGPRPRTADDDDWGTSDPPIPMDLIHPHQPPPEIAAIDADPTPKPRVPVVQKLKQQELSSYTVTFSPRVVITLYFAMAILFIPLGAAIVAGTSKISSSGRLVYSNITNCAENTETDKGGECTVNISFPHPVPAPSYFYYSITNYHQNARKYAKSRSDVMNQGKLPKTLFDVETCEPHLYSNDTFPVDGFNPKELVYPCGLTARSFFNDTFTLCVDERCDEIIDMEKKGIAWWTDLEHKFNKGEDILFSQPIPDFKPADSPLITANDLLEDEDFVVWMRLSAFPDFDKLYRIINTPLEANTSYYVRIKTRYPVEEFGGTKAFYISTMSWLGGPNAFLGTAYLVVGFIALFIATTLLVKHVRNPRPPAYSDPEIVMRELAKLNGDYRVAPPGQ